MRLVQFSELDGWGVLTLLDTDQVARSAHYVTPEGVEYHGGESITRSLRLVPFGAAAALFDLWGLALVREIVYALVAGNRSLVSRLLGRAIELTARAGDGCEPAVDSGYSPGIGGRRGATPEDGPCSAVVWAAAPGSGAGNRPANAGGW